MKVQIDLPQDVYQKLKEDAKTHFQSLRGHIAFRLINEVRGITSNTNTNIIDLSALPEGTTIRTTTSTSKKSIPRRNLIKEATDNGGIFEVSLRVHGDDNEPFTDDEYQDALEHSYPDYILDNPHPDFITLKKYYESFRSSQEEQSEARERFVNLPHSAALRMHEEPYLLDVFTFTPPADEPDLYLDEYINRICKGGYYDNDRTPRLIRKPGI